MNWVEFKLDTKEAPTYGKYNKGSNLKVNKYKASVPGLSSIELLYWGIWGKFTGSYYDFVTRILKSLV